MTRRFRYKEIQLAQLRSFCLAAAKGNFSSAAEAAGLSLSTVWEQIRALERKFGVTLLRRQGRTAKLTREGQLLLEAVGPFFDRLDGLQELFASRTIEPVRELSLATAPYVLHHILPGTMKTFAAEHPSVHVTVQLPDPFAVASLVERGSVDFAVHAYDREQPNPALQYDELVAVPLQVLVPAGHRLSRKKHVTLDDLGADPVIRVGKETFAHRIIQRVLERHGLTNRLTVTMEMTAPDAIQEYVMHGPGIAVIHISREDKLLKGLRRVYFDPPLEPLPFAFITRKNRTLSPLIHAFQRIAAEKLKGL